MKKYYLLLIIFVMISNLSATNFGKNKIQTEKIDWKKIETLHFDIYFPAGYEKFAKIATLLSENAYYRIKADLGKPIKSRIPIIFYKSHQNFEVTNVIAPLLNEGVGGFTELSKNRVAIPFDGSYKKLEEIITHELTHAYINASGSGFSRILTLNHLPFWFAEGFPEFEAVHGEDVYNNLIIVDLLFNSNWGNIQEIGGYFAYRLGESFLVYLEEKYGRESVANLYYALRFQPTLEAAFNKVFNKEFELIQKEWINHLKRKYYPTFVNYEIPYEEMTRKTNHLKDGSRLNYAPRFSPDGNHIIYFSDKNLRTNIYKTSALGLYKNKKILNGESSGKFEEFHFQNNNISWFSDSKKFALVSKTANGDKIYVIDFQTSKIITQFDFPKFDAIYEIDVSHDDKKIVFCGQKNFQADIFVFDITENKISQITNDKFYNAHPRWSNDDTKIAFSSERTISKRKNSVFGNMSSDIFYYDLKNNKFFQITFDNDKNNTHPIWFENKIIFSTEREFTFNYDVIDLEKSQRAEVTNIHEGVFTADITNDGKEMVCSVYFEKGWDIYLKSNPLDNIKYIACKKLKEVQFFDDFYDIFQLENHKYFGKRERKFKNEIKTKWQQDDEFNFVQAPEIDSSIVEFNLKIDEKPTEIKIPEISDYRTKFMLDYLWGGGAYLPSGGTYLQLQIGLSDLMGDHAIAVELGITGELEKSNVVLRYLNLANRIDYGIGAFHLYDEWIYYFEKIGNPADYHFERIRKKDFGVFGILRYPFNKFWRVDFESILYKSEINFDFADEDDTEWQEDYLDNEENYFYSPQVSLVHDNAIYSSTGPLDGAKFKLTLNTNISQDQSPNSQVYADIRNYILMGRRYSFATRFSGGKIWGDSLNVYQIDYYHDGVRGFNNLENEEVLIGQNKALASVELRFPFVDDLNIAFPFPLHFRQIRGSAFVDIGSVWNEKTEFEENLKYGIGFGPRLNMGYFILKLDVAWQYRTNSFSKPTYYFGLSEEF